MTIETKQLTPALAADYFDFFDNRAFTDHEEWSCCYCTFFHMTEEHKRHHVDGIAGAEDWTALRRELKGLAERFIREGTLRGYLAYADGVSVGWCNANDRPGRVKAVLCFTVAPEFRNMGIATALLERVLADAKAEGFAAAEGYPRLRDERDPFDYYGPARLYEKLGFAKVSEKDGAAVMRKEL